MARSAVVAIAAAVSAAAAAAVAPSSTTPLFVMPWMCLERCGDNASSIAAQLEQLRVNRSVFTDASFELFNLGPNSSLVYNNLTRVAPAVNALGLGSLAMVSSYPYPPEFLTWMRQVFADPAPFVDACVDAARTFNLSGFNIDWEPTDANGAPKPTPEDAAAYAGFLDSVASAFHSLSPPLLLSVDVATWSPIWNLRLIGQTGVDRVMTMGTYTAGWGEWQEQLELALAAIPPSKLVVGLETDNGVNATGLAQRFGALKAAGVRQIAIWRSGIPDDWWPFLDAFVAGG